MRCPALPAAIGALLVCSGPSHAGTVTTYPDGYFADRDNDNGTLIVFVAGLAGKESWSAFVPLVESEDSLVGADFLVYETPGSLDVEDNVRRLGTVLVGLPVSYPRMIYVGHSIGGIIVKRLILRQIGRPDSAHLFPDIVITYGTPYKIDSFNITATRNLFGQVGWAFMSRLRRDVFNLERLSAINRAWRSAEGTAPLDRARIISVFGIEDTIAPAADERSSATTIFVKGDHMGIVSASCCVQILAATVGDRDADLSTLPCVLQ